MSIRPRRVKRMAIAATVLLTWVGTSGIGIAQGVRRQRRSYSVRSRQR
jgi:hypothetical protein